ncbi:MAG TPA: hypothetical protein ENH84_07760 [Phycisphaerae bacterium]|nr:hypothetical protein [Phycisphaerae bacterium]
MFGLALKESSQPKKIKRTSDFVDLLSPRINIVFGKYFSERVPAGKFHKTELVFEKGDDDLIRNVRVFVTVEGAKISRSELQKYFDCDDYTGLDEEVEGMVDQTISVFCKPWAVDMCGLLDEIERVSDDRDVKALCRHRFALAERHGLTIKFLGPVDVGTA